MNEGARMALNLLAKSLSRGQSVKATLGSIETVYYGGQNDLRERMLVLARERYGAGDVANIEALIKDAMIP